MPWNKQNINKNRFFSLFTAVGATQHAPRRPFGGSTLHLAKLSFNLAYPACERRFAVC